MLLLATYMENNIMLLLIWKNHVSNIKVGSLVSTRSFSILFLSASSNNTWPSE